MNEYNTHVYAQTHAHTYKHMHTHTHACRHTHAYAHTFTHEFQDFNLTWVAWNFSTPCRNFSTPCLASPHLIRPARVDFRTQQGSARGLAHRLRLQITYDSLYFPVLFVRIRTERFACCLQCQQPGKPPSAATWPEERALCPVETAAELRPEGIDSVDHKALRKSRLSRPSILQAAPKGATRRFQRQPWQSKPRTSSAGTPSTQLRPMPLSTGRVRSRTRAAPQLHHGRG